MGITGDKINFLMGHMVKNRRNVSRDVSPPMLSGFGVIEPRGG
jgi:hypothetical protein